ncbi:hypothetical protein OF83DRAFT_151873 [Amylostereum chailletii]|nr:hypothetical protein OF83DRAFT_151873 [Amylostereum chailletii]
MFFVVLRLTAIWERDPIITSLGVILWLANFPVDAYREHGSIAAMPTGIMTQCFLVVDVYKIQTFPQGCLNEDIRHHLLPIFVTLFVTESVLLVLMLYRIRRSLDAVHFGLWCKLYQQGVVGLILCAVAELPIIVSANVQPTLAMTKSRLFYPRAGDAEPSH